MLQFVRGMWDARGPGAKRAEGWVNVAHIATVERAGRDRFSEHGQTVVEPVAIVTVAGGRCVTVSGPDAVRLFQICELRTIQVKPQNDQGYWTDLSA